MAQQNLLIKCPDELPVPDGKAGKAWIEQSKQWSAIYHDCKIRHNGLVDVVIKAKPEQK